MIAYVVSYLRSKLIREKDNSTESLIKNGLKVGRNFVRPGDCSIDIAHCWLISIGDNVTMTRGVTILAHDASTKRHLGYTKIGLVEIGNNVFVGVGSVILPNVKIGDNVIIGAGSVVSKDIPENSVAVGNPARVICKTSEYILKHKELMCTRPVFDSKWTKRLNITDEQKQEMIRKLSGGIGYVE